MTKDRLKSLLPKLDRFIAEIQPKFGAGKTAAHLGVYMRGQLGGLERKSVQPIADDAGVSARTLEEFFSIHRWSADELRGNVVGKIAREHGSPAGIGVLDETSFVKRGPETVGVQRQYCGHLGKIENCVVTVHLVYASEDFHAPVDGDLYLPKSWADDPARRARAGVPDAVRFRTKWEIGLDLVDRTRAAGLALRWITADEGYGEVPAFHVGLAARDLGYVVEVPRSIHGWTPRGRRRARQSRRLERLFKRGGPSWETYRVKDTTRGPLVWEVRRTAFHPSWDPVHPLTALIAWNPLTDETKYFLSNAGEDVPTATLLAVAFSRWRVERVFQDAKSEVGLDHFEMRKYSALQRHFAISMASLLFLYEARRSLGGFESIHNRVEAQRGDGDPARAGRLRGRDRPAPRQALEAHRTRRPRLEGLAPIARPENPTASTVRGG